MNLTHQPKGSMCMACKLAHWDCRLLPFKQMPVIEVDKQTGVNIVRCTHFKKPITETPQEAGGKAVTP